MKTTYLYVALLSLVLATSSLALATSLEAEGNVDVSKPTIRQDFTFMDVLGRDFEEENRQILILSLVTANKAFKNGNIEEALKAYLEAARYGDIRALYGVGACYDKQNNLLDAFKWISAALDEWRMRSDACALRHDNLKHYEQAANDCVAFLSSKSNQDALKTILLNKLVSEKGLGRPQRKKQQLNINKWAPFFNFLPQTRYDINRRDIYLTAQEIDRKYKSIYPYALGEKEGNQIYQDYCRAGSQGSLFSSRQDFVEEMKKSSCYEQFLFLGLYYQSEKNYPEAYKYFNKIIEGGGGIEKILSTLPTTRFFSTFFEASMRSSQLLLLFDPDNPGQAVDFNKVFSLYEKLIDYVQKNYDFLKHSMPHMSELIVDLYSDAGIMFEQGKGCADNKEHAFCYMRAAYNINHDGDTAYNLGRYYLEGIGVTQDTATGISYLEEAVGKKVSAACAALADFYKVRNEVEKSFQYIERGANLGDPDLQLLYAEHLSDGWGCQMDRVQARSVLKELLAKDFSFAYFSLADLSFQEAHSFKERLYHFNEALAFIRREAKLLKGQPESGKRCDLICYAQRLITLCLNTVKIPFTVWNYDERMSLVQEIQELQGDLYTDAEKHWQLYYQAVTAYGKGDIQEAKRYFSAAHLMGMVDPLNLEEVLWRKELVQLSEGETSLEEENLSQPSEEILSDSEQEDLATAEERAQAEVTSPPSSELLRLKKSERKSRVSPKEKARKAEEKEATRRMARLNKMMSQARMMGAGIQTLEPRALVIKFVNDKVKESYNTLLDSPVASTLSKLIQSIKEGTNEGRPEKLKGNYGFSRRITHKERLVYDYTGPNEITILGCECHYHGVKPLRK